MRIATPLILALSLTIGSVPARAQFHTPRRGVWGRIGVGYGSAGTSCNGCGASTGSGGLTVSALVGGTPSPHVLIGVGFDLFERSLAGDTLERMDALGASLWYFSHVTGGPFAEGGVGVSEYRRERGSYVSGWFGSLPNTDLDGYGVNLHVGIGWEFDTARGPISVRLADNYGQAGTLTRYFSNQPAPTGWTNNVLAIEVGYSYWPRRY